MNVKRFHPVLLSAATFALLCAGPASAQMQAMSEQEMSSTHAQGLFILNNTSADGFDFTRITFGADVTLNANFRNIRLGEYNYAPRNGTGADIDMPLLQFGRSDGTYAQRLVQISNPYIEFVYRNVANAATREVVGMRFGFESLNGEIGLTMNTVSGSVLIDGGAAGVADSNTDTVGGGKRWDGSCTAPCLPLAQVGAVRAGDANGGSRDFWMSTLKVPVQFQSPSGLAAPQVAQAGFWMNWRDRVAATNTTGTPPPNLPYPR